MTGNAGLGACRRDPVSAACFESGDECGRFKVAASASMSSPAKEKLKVDIF